MQRLDAQNMVEWLVFWAVWAVFWSVVTNVKLRGIGFLLNPVDAGRLDYPVVLFFALLISQRKWMKYLILILSFFSFSNKIYLGFTLGLAGFLFGNAKYKGFIFLGMLGLLAVLTIVDFEELLKQTVFIGRTEVSLEQSSGRYYVWQVAWEAFKDSPLIGHGFVAGENEVLYAKFKGAINTHSFVFSGLLSTGLLGTVFLLAYFSSVFKLGLKKVWPKDRWRPAIIGTLIMALVVSLTAPGVGSRVYGSWISVVLVLTMIAALYYKFKFIQINQ
jgi:O-antigen ligase